MLFAMFLERRTCLADHRHRRSHLLGHVVDQVGRPCMYGANKLTVRFTRVRQRSEVSPE